MGHGSWVCHYSLGLFEIQSIPRVTMVLRADTVLSIQIYTSAKKSGLTQI